MLLNKDNLEILVYDALSACIEEMAFMEVEPSSISQEEDDLIVTIKLFYEKTCRFSLSYPKPLALELAENIFGDEMDKINDNNLIDTMSELMNTFAGSLARSLIPENKQYELSLPENYESSHKKTLYPHKYIFGFSINDEHTITVLLEEE